MAATVFGASVTISAGSLKIESGTRQDLTLSWSTFTAAAQRGQLELVGSNAWSKAQVYIKGMPGLLRSL